MKNPNPLLSSPPSPEELAVFEDPRVKTLTPQFPAYPEMTKLVLEPAQPAPEHSRFLRAHTTRFGSRTANHVEWLSPKTYIFSLGRGNGFEKLTERPRVFQNVQRPAKPPHIWQHHQYFIVSPQVRDVFCRFDAASVEFCEIDWEYRDGTRLEGYGLLDIIRLIYAYDYSRSRIEISLDKESRKTLFVGHDPTVLREDIPSGIHFFREARWRRPYFSHEIASELAPFAAKDLEFVNPHRSFDAVKFSKRTKKTESEPAPPPAIVHHLPAAPKTPGAGMHNRISREILPLLEAGDFTTAENQLVQWMRELPESPLHVAIAPGVGITNSPADVADYITAFCTEASKEYKPKVFYAEMNAFVVNTDRWFFGLFAFAEDGGREAYDWLGDFYAATDESCLITGLEPLQAAYATAGLGRAGNEDLLAVTEALVIVRFQRLLRDALLLVKRKVKLLASAHDSSACTVEIEYRK